MAPKLTGRLISHCGASAAWAAPANANRTAAAARVLTGVFENPQKVNKLNEEGSILNEIAAPPNPQPEQNRYIPGKKATG
ncbi:hypothetical protein G6F65_022437 [Rhizopus arrhizus]|nr:hypothetical protein G6F65_022437 [Rhizopus arrhizus]